MLINATIQLVLETGAGYDSNGNPEASTKVLSDALPVNKRTLQMGIETYVDGSFLRSRFSVYIAESMIPSDVEITNIKTVIVADLHGVSSESLLVHDCEKLSKFKQIKLILG